MPNPTVAHVDTDETVRTTVVEQLSPAGIRVLSASSGAEFLKLCEEHSPSLALVELNLPGLSGLEVAQRLCEDTDIAIMFLSDSVKHDEVRMMTEYHAVGFLAKPVHDAQLLPAVLMALRCARRMGELAEAEWALKRALESGRYTGAAVGLLMQRHSLTYEDAFETLRIHARRRRIAVTALARHLVDSTDELHHVTPQGVSAGRRQRDDGGRKTRWNRRQGPPRPAQE